MKKKYIAWYILILMAALAFGWRVGFDQARKTAQLVEVSDSEYTIVYGDFVNTYDR